MHRENFTEFKRFDLTNEKKKDINLERYLKSSK